MVRTFIEVFLFLAGLFLMKMIEASFSYNKDRFILRIFEIIHIEAIRPVLH